MRKFIKSAFELFKKSEPVIFTEFDNDFLSFVKDKNLSALNAMLKEGYVPNRQIEGRLKKTALASLEVYDTQYRQYAQKINEAYPDSYIDFSQITLKPLAFPFLYIMVENRILNKDFLQNFVTSSKKKVNITPFPFGEKKFQSSTMESDYEIFQHTHINYFLQSQNQYLWQDLVSPNEDKKTLSEVNSISSTDHDYSLLFNETSEVAGIILYKLKNPKSSIKEAINFCENKFKQEYDIINNNDNGKLVFLNKFKEEFLDNIRKSLHNLSGMEKKLLFVNYYMNIIGDGQVSAQQVFSDIYNENIISSGKASNILKMLAVIYQKDIIIDKNERALLNIEKNNFFSFFDTVIKENLSCFNKKNQEEELQNRIFSLKPEDNILLKQQQYLNHRLEEQRSLNKNNEIVKAPVLANTLERLRNRKATSSIIEFKIDDLIDNKILKDFKNDLLLFKDSYDSINKEKISDDQKSFVSEIYYELMNSLSLYIEMKELNIESDTYPQIVENIQKMAQKVEDIAKEQSIEQIYSLNKDKKNALRKTM